MMEEVKVVPLGFEGSLPPSPSLGGVGDSTLLQSSTSESSLLSTLDTQHFKEAYRANHRSPLYSVGHAFVVFLNVTCCALLIVACWIKSRHFLKANFPEAAYWQDIGAFSAQPATDARTQLASVPTYTGHACTPTLTTSPTAISPNHTTTTRCHNHIPVCSGHHYNGGVPVGREPADA